MLSFNDVACRRDGSVLFEQASFIVQRGQKVGLTGANGTGKSSLFAMVRGALEPDAGSISLQNGIAITHVAQETAASERRALDYVLDGDRTLRALEDTMAALQESDGLRHAELLTRYEEAGGWTAAARAGALLNGLGFATEQHARAVTAFSGGWRMRLNLAQALMSPAELLLLDEPTNHLDLDAVLWLENWLMSREGSLVLVSHDREFLDAVTTHTLHIERKTVTMVTGNYTAFERWRAARLGTQQAQHEKTQRRRKELQGFVDRFRAKATKARQAQSRLKMLERLGETEAVREDSPFTFSFRKPDRLPAPLVSLRDVKAGYGPVTVLDRVRFSIESGERFGLLGVNGAGKSTLVKTLVGDLTPQDGDRVEADHLKVGYFAQHQVDQLNADSTALRVLTEQDPTLDETRARTFLGGFGFLADQVHQRIGTLSGGERARLALSLIVHAKPNLLLLDEPTNHLDIDMRQALASALNGFEGGLVVISHDRTMLRSVVDELYVVARGRVEPFDDDLDGYARWLANERQVAAQASAIAPGGEEDAVAATPDTPRSATAGPEAARGTATAPIDARVRKRQEADRRARLAPLKKAVERAERELARCTQTLETLRERLADPELYTEGRRKDCQALLAQEATARDALTDAENGLLDDMQALDDATDGERAA